MLQHGVHLSLLVVPLHFLVLLGQLALGRSTQSYLVVLQILSSLIPIDIQEAARDDINQVDIVLRLTNVAALTTGFHMSDECHRILEATKAFGTTVVSSYVVSGNEMSFENRRFFESKTFGFSLAANEGL